MDYYINKVEQEIETYKTLINSTVKEDGYGLERRSAIVWDILEYWLKGYIEDSLYKELYNSWQEVVHKVYNNKKLCIC